MIAPEAPTGGAVREAVLDDQPDGGLDDAAGIVTAWSGQVGHVGVEELAAAGAIVLGIEHDQVTGPAGESVAEVVEGAAGRPVAVGAVAAARAGPATVVAAADADLGLG